MTLLLYDCMGTVDAHDDNVTYFTSVFTLKSWQRSSLNSPVEGHIEVSLTAINVEFFQALLSLS